MESYFTRILFAAPWIFLIQICSILAADTPPLTDAEKIAIIENLAHPLKTEIHLASGTKALDLTDPKTIIKLEKFGISQLDAIRLHAKVLLKYRYDQNCENSPFCNSTGSQPHSEVIFSCPCPTDQADCTCRPLVPYSNAPKNIFSEDFLNLFQRMYSTPYLRQNAQEAIYSLGLFIADNEKLANTQDIQDWLISYLEKNLEQIGTDQVIKLADLADKVDPLKPEQLRRLQILADKSPVGIQTTPILKLLAKNNAVGHHSYARLYHRLAKHLIEHLPQTSKNKGLSHWLHYQLARLPNNFSQFTASELQLFKKAQKDRGFLSHSPPVLPSWLPDCADRFTKFIGISR